MATFIATYPPLGQVTRLQDSDLTFHAVLEAPRELAAESWQLALWHSTGDTEEWAEAEFLAGSPGSGPSDLHEASDTTARLYFTAKLAIQYRLNFTVKFRQGPDHEWLWIHKELGVEDGIVVVEKKPTAEGDSDDLPDLIQDLNPDLKWKSHASQSPATRLWSIESGIDAAKEHESTYADVPLGVPWGQYLR
jgi:hypothetical protein